MIGKNQLALLCALGQVGCFLVVPDKRSDALVKRGLLVPADDKSAGFIRITSAGLRALADAMDAGRLNDRLDPNRPASSAAGARPETEERPGKVDTHD